MACFGLWYLKQLAEVAYTYTIDKCEVNSLTFLACRRGLLIAFFYKLNELV